MRFRHIIISAALSGIISAPIFSQQSQSPSPTPTAVVQPSPLPAAMQTLAELQGKIRRSTFAPQLRRARIGIKVVTLAKGTVVFENESEKYFMPASNMKNFTVAAALEKLSPDFRFVTRVRAAARPDQDGLVRGNLTIVGAGDVSLSYSFLNDDYYRGIDMLAEKIKAAGVKRVEGDLIADQSYFRGFRIPASWEWDDLQWYHGAEVSALPLNDNVVDLSVRPGSAGNQCIVRILPQTTLYRIVNTCRTGTSGSQQTLAVHRWLDQNVIEISGSIPANAAAFNRKISFALPAELFVGLLKERLQKIGVEVKGRSRLMDTIDGTTPKAEAIEITNLESPPLALIAAKTMKPSQNMYTETLLWTLGEQTGRAKNPNTESSILGINAVKDFLRSTGLADDSIIQYDGSGLSRHNLITPAAVVHLYSYMAKTSRYSQAWRDSLTIGGVDGTLRRRFVGTAAAANIRGKTGTLDQVSALSGYVRTVGGEELVVSLVINNTPGETGLRTSVLDEIVVALANFNGRID